MITPQRPLLSVQVHNTQKLLTSFLIMGAVLLGTIYVFLFNKLAMRGYVLQQESEKKAVLMVQKEKITTKIARYETQDFVSASPSSQGMIVLENQNFAVIKSNEFTAKK